MGIPVNTFWLTVMNVALGLAVLLGMLVVALSLVEEMWARHRRQRRQPIAADCSL